MSFISSLPLHSNHPETWWFKTISRIAPPESVSSACSSICGQLWAAWHPMALAGARQLSSPWCLTPWLIRLALSPSIRGFRCRSAHCLRRPSTKQAHPYSTGQSNWQGQCRSRGHGKQTLPFLTAGAPRPHSKGRGGELRSSPSVLRALASVAWYSVILMVARCSCWNRVAGSRQSGKTLPAWLWDVKVPTWGNLQEEFSAARTLHHRAGWGERN